MSDSRDVLQKQLRAASDLKSMVRAMKAIAASSLAQYEQSAVALQRYHRNVELGLIACLRDRLAGDLQRRRAPDDDPVGVVLFGSDQGLIGQFNESLAAHLRNELPPSPKVTIWAVGERVAAAAADLGYANISTFRVPSSIQSIGTLVGHLLIDIQRLQHTIPTLALHLLHNQKAVDAAFAVQYRRVLPLDEAWLRSLALGAWPTTQAPQLWGSTQAVRSALVREYLFVSLFRACAESWGSEQATRLSGMERADRNIDDRLDMLRRRSQQLRQSAIDGELFDVISGFEALAAVPRSTAATHRQ